MKDKIYWIYILHCENESYYTGYTTDLIRRFQEHLLGTLKCKYTRSFKPVNVAQCWQVFGNKALAMKIERYIKKMSKTDKQKIILSPNLISDLFACNQSLKIFQSLQD